MKQLILAVAVRNNKVVETRILQSRQEMEIYSLECRQRECATEFHKFPVFGIFEATKKEHEVQYIPPPQWGGRVVCVETGWIFTSIAAAAAYMHGSQWALRKAVIRNTLYHHFHWRMYTDRPKKVEKFT